jgi:hypothetical protein
MERIEDLVRQSRDVVVAANAHKPAVGDRRSLQKSNGRVGDCIVADIDLHSSRRVQ